RADLLNHDGIDLLDAGTRRIRIADRDRVERERRHAAPAPHDEAERLRAVGEVKPVVAAADRLEVAGDEVDARELDGVGGIDRLPAAERADAMEADVGKAAVLAL